VNSERISFESFTDFTIAKDVVGDLRSKFMEHISNKLI